MSGGTIIRLTSDLEMSHYKQMRCINFPTMDINVCIFGEVSTILHVLIVCWYRNECHESDRLLRKMRHLGV